MANNVLDQDRRYNRTNPYLPVSTGPMTRPAIGRTAPAAMAAPTSAAAAPVPASQFVRPQVNAPKPTTFEGVNLEVPTSGPSVAYRAGRALPGLVRAAGAAARGVGTVASATSDVLSYPGRKFVNDTQQLIAGATGAAAPAPAQLIRPNVAAEPVLAEAGTAMPRTKGAVIRDGRSASAARPAVAPPAATPAARTAPTAAATTPTVAATVATGAATPAAPALDGGGTFNGRPVAELLRNPSNPISVIPSGQAPAQFTDAGAGIAADGTVAPIPVAAGAPVLTRPAITRAAVRAPRGGIEFNDMFGGGLRGADNATAMANFQSEMRYGKYTPSARRAIAALAGQGVQFQNEQDNAGLKAVNDAGAAAAAAANEAALSDSNNAAAAQINNARLASEERRTQMGTVTGEDGTIFTRVGSTAAPLTTADGKPVRDAPTAAQGQITAQDRLKALTEQLTAESSALQPNAERINALQGQIDALTSGGQQAAAPPEGAVKMLRENPAMAAQFDAKYGAGSAAKFLGAK